jgi:hypothetical protein
MAAAVDALLAASIQDESARQLASARPFLTIPRPRGTTTLRRNAAPDEGVEAAAAAAAAARRCSAFSLAGTAGGVDKANQDRVCVDLCVAEGGLGAAGRPGTTRLLAVFDGETCPPDRERGAGGGVLATQRQ